jgi:hypothetical protein
MTNETIYNGPVKSIYAIDTLKNKQDNMYAILNQVSHYVEEELYLKVCKAMYIKIDEIQDEINDIEQDKKIHL